MKIVTSSVSAATRANRGSRADSVLFRQRSVSPYLRIDWLKLLVEIQYRVDSFLLSAVTFTFFAANGPLANLARLH